MHQSACTVAAVPELVASAAAAGAGDGAAV